jgi:TolB-like protein
MGDATDSGSDDSSKPTHGERHPSVWSRVKNHKVIQWCVAYLGIALALAQGHELVAAAFDWPDVTGRVLIVALAVGLPITVTIAWYRGHRGLQNLSAGELAIVSVLLLIGAVFFTVALRPAQPAAVAAAPAPATAASEPAPATAGLALKNKIAVLPCQNLSPNEADAYFAIGLHDEIVLKLATVRSLDVVPPRAVLRYADTMLSPREIAAELDARALVDCTVRYAAGRVRITARLFAASGDATPWSQAYERDLADVFAVQADIAANIASALSVEFSAEERARISSVQTSSPEAYGLWLRAISTGNEEQREALLERAVEVDPTFAAPYAQLAFIEATRFINDDGNSALPPAERARIERLVRDYADRALAIDPYSARAHAAKAVPAFFSWRWTDAEASFRRVLESDRDPGSSVYYIYMLTFWDRPDEADALLSRAISLDPELPGLGIGMGYAGDEERALAALRSTLDRSPTFLIHRLFVAFIEAARGNSSAAVEELRISEQIAGERPALAFLPEWAYAYSRAGRADEAQRLFRATEARAASGESPGLGGWASAYLAIGDERRALEMLEEAARKAGNHEPDEGFWNLMNLRTNPTGDPVLEKLEFASVLERIKGD